MLFFFSVSLTIINFMMAMFMDIIFEKIFEIIEKISKNQESGFVVFLIVAVFSFFFSAFIVAYVLYLVKDKWFSNILLLPKEPLSQFLIMTVVVVMLSNMIAFLFEHMWSNRFYKEYLPIPNYTQILIPLALGGFFSLLLISTNYIKAFSALYMIYTIIDNVGMVLYLSTIRPEIYRLLSDNRNEKTEAVAKFYMSSILTRLGIIKIIVSIIACILAFLDKNELAYTIIIALILVNEVVWWFKRFLLYRVHNFPL